MPAVVDRVQSTLPDHKMIPIKTIQSVDAYLSRVLGSEYTGSPATLSAKNGSFFVNYHHRELPQPCIVGRVMLAQPPFSHNGNSEAILSLTGEQIQEIHETAAWELARRRGELARTEEGYLSRHQARRLARQWLDQHLSMKFGASGGLWIPLTPKVWQFSIYFSLQNLHLEPLGCIDVNAETGDVIPLSKSQINHLRERVNAIIKFQTPTTTA